MNESLHSLFLAQAIGVYLLILSVVLISRAEYYRGLLVNIKSGSPAMFVGALVGLILGILMVLDHNIWVWNPELLVTLVAWIVLFKSVFWLTFPEPLANFSRKLCVGKGYYIAAATAGIVGVVLLVHGFALFHLPHF